MFHDLTMYSQRTHSIRTPPLILAVLLFAVLMTGCAASGKTREEKRAAILNMRNDVLTQLYAEKPSVREQIAAADGYGVFSNANVNIIFASMGGGFGVVEKRTGGERTYMKMGEVGLGLGAGIKDYRLVMVFHTSEALDYFVEHGWSFGAQGDAAAKAGDIGGAVGGEMVVNNVSVYQMTESGLALQATLKGTKYWRDGNLN